MGQIWLGTCFHHCVWNTAVLTVCGCFCTVMAELSSCPESPSPHSLKHLLFGPLQKRLLTPVLNIASGWYWKDMLPLSWPSRIGVIFLNPNEHETICSAWYFCTYWSSYFSPFLYFCFMCACVALRCSHLAICLSIFSYSSAISSCSVLCSFFPPPPPQTGCNMKC